MTDWIKKAHLESWARSEKSYYRELPEELKPYYVYLSDCGHNFITLLKDIADGENSTDFDDYLCPVPVKTVLRGGYYIDENGYLIAKEKLEYSSEIGLLDSQGDTEF